MNKRKKIKYILISVYIITTIYVVGLLIYNMYVDSKIEYKENNDSVERLSATVNLQEESTGINGIALNTEEVEDQAVQVQESQEDILVKDYKVIAKLEIPKIGLITDVIEEYSKETLLVSVTKFWGGEPNEIGNFCIAGHNHQNKNMFSKLKKLEVGDELFLTDNYNKTVKYEVYDVFKVESHETRKLISKNKWKKRSYFNNMYNRFKIKNYSKGDRTLITRWSHLLQRF